MGFNINSKKQETISIVVVLVVYAVVFLPVAFLQTKTTALMLIDPQSIVESLKGLTTYPYYNMNAQYHSQFYGWVYFSLNFFVIMIAKVFGVLSESNLIQLVRVTHFAIGGFLLVAIYKLAVKIFDPLVSVLLVLVFMVNPISAAFIYTIHPETLGLLLQAIGIMLLLKAYHLSTFSWKTITFACVFLSLSGLAKQAFLIVSILIAITFFIVYYNKKSGRDFFATGNLLKVVGLSSGVFLLCALIIHPFAFFQFSKFYDAQMHLKMEHASKDFMPLLIPWLKEISTNFLYMFNVLITASVLILRKTDLVFKLSAVFSLLISILFIFNARLFITSNYLYPLYLIFTFNAFYFTFKIFPKLFTAKSKCLYYSINIALVLLLVFNGVVAINKAHSFYLLEKSNTQLKSWAYIEGFDKKTKIAYSPTVALPPLYRAIGCSAWQGCADYKALEKYSPDVIVSVPGYRYYKEDEYSKYIQVNGYSLVKKFVPSIGKEVSECGKISFIVVNEYLKSHLFNCYSNYQSMLDIYDSDSYLIGEPISIYQKEK
jgi:hypothetical protein